MVRLYTQPGCMPCMVTKRSLDKAGIEFETVDVREDPAAAEELRRRGFPSTPAVVATVGGREYAWSGHRPDDIAALAFLLKEAAA